MQTSCETNILHVNPFYPGGGHLKVSTIQKRDGRGKIEIVYIVFVNVPQFFEAIDFENHTLSLRLRCEFPYQKYLFLVHLTLDLLENKHFHHSKGPMRMTESNKQNFNQL